MAGVETIRMGEINIEPHEEQALNQGEGNQENGNVNENENETQSRDVVAKFRRFFHSDGFNIFIQVIYFFLLFPWIPSIVFFSIFDTRCIIFEQASVINCTQDFFIPNPRHWVFAWLLMSITSSVLFVVIVILNHKKLNYKWKQARKIYQKGSFWSLMFLLLISLIFYLIRLLSTSSDKTSMSISVLVILWPPFTVTLACCLNYVPQVRWTKPGPRRCTLAWYKECLAKNSLCIIYWLALFAYSLELTLKLAAIMFDVAHEVAPLIQHKFPSESSGYLKAPMVLAIGFRLAFHARLLSFFWQKIFHGEKDLLSEPSLKLDKEPEQGEQEEEEPERGEQKKQKPKQGSQGEEEPEEDEQEEEEPEHGEQEEDV